MYLASTGTQAIMALSWTGRFGCLKGMGCECSTRPPPLSSVCWVHRQRRPHFLGFSWKFCQMLLRHRLVGCWLIKGFNWRLCLAFICTGWFMYWIWFSFDWCKRCSIASIRINTCSCPILLAIYCVSPVWLQTFEDKRINIIHACILTHS